MLIDTIDLGELVQAIEQYNSQFGLGSLMASILNSSLRGETKEGLDFEIGSQISWGDIERRFKDVIKATGISLEAVGGYATIFTGEDQIPSSQMRINLADSRVFVKYLNTLSRETLTPSQRYGLEKVADNFTLQLSKEYRLNDPSDNRVLNLFSQLEQVISSYQKLGLGNSTERLSEYLEFARKGCLLDYITIQRQDLFAEIGGNNFGPSRWHIDMSPEYYQSRWSGALDTLDRVSQNPRAAELAQRLRVYLKQSAEYAQRDLMDNPRLAYIPDVNKQAFKETLGYVAQRLGQVSGK